MKKTTNHECRNMMAAVAISAAALLMTGCAGFSAKTATDTPMAGPALHGSVFGGRQPISGATLTLYAANNTGTTYGAANTNLLTQTTRSNPDGTFNITGLYSCSAGQQMYIVALGGDPGSGTNPQSGIMAALGDCSSLSASTFINMNEVTTVGSVFALAPFMRGYSALGAPSTNNAGLVRAFNSVKKLVNITTGQQYGSSLPANATGPSAEIASLANVLATCVNSTGGSASDTSTNCGALFALATPNGGTAPTNTIDAALLIAQNPSLNAAAIYNRMPPANPYNPTLSGPPADWTMSVVYKPSGLNTPSSTTVDANGQVWIANSGNNTVMVLAQTGTPAMTVSGNGLTTPTAVAIDANGNAWVANKGGSTVSAFTNAGGVFGSSPFTVGSAPTALAFDSIGQLFVANSTSNSISVLNGSGAPVTTITTGVSAPSAVVINPK